MEICCRGGAADGGAVCAKAGATRLRKAKREANVGWAKARLRAFAHAVKLACLDSVGKAASHKSSAEWLRHAGDAPLPTLRRAKKNLLIIDHHAPRNTPDWNRNRGLA